MIAIVLDSHILIVSQNHMAKIDLITEYNNMKISVKLTHANLQRPLHVVIILHHTHYRASNTRKKKSQNP
jgi:uncharacterized protein Usg